MPALHLAVALDGAGWHPAAWREPGARPAELLTAGYWTDLVTEAEHGLLDFVTIEDSLGLQPADGSGQVQGRLDAVLIAARVAPLTRNIGLIPTVIVTHTEPFHASKAIATLDYVSSGRAGLRVRVSASQAEAALIGRRSIPPVDPADRADPAARQLVTDLFDEAADYVEVVRRLWDSWDDDAEIRDVSTGRFVDRGKLHYVDFEGRWFTVRGPSITPRPPQGQPVVAALAHWGVPFGLVGRAADIGFVTPKDAAQAAGLAGRIRAAQAEAGRSGQTVRVFGDILTYLDSTEAAALARRDRLDERAGARYASDALTFAGSPAQLADLMLDWQSAGLTGFRLRPAAVPHDLTQITRVLVPELQRRGAFRESYDAGTLRGLLGLAQPASRFAGRVAQA